MQSTLVFPCIFTTAWVVLPLLALYPAPPTHTRGSGRVSVVIYAIS